MIMYCISNVLNPFSFFDVRVVLLNFLHLNKKKREMTSSPVEQTKNNRCLDGFFRNKQ